MTRFEWIVAANEAGVRLDLLIAGHLPALGRRAASALFADGAVCVDGRRVRKGERAVAGCRIDVEMSESSTEPLGALEAPSQSLDIRFLREDLLVVYKVMGQPTAPQNSEETGTLANALVAHFPELRGVGYSPLEPGLIHRLDTGTSGLVLVARGEPTFRGLVERLRAGRLGKRYWAVVEGTGLPPQGEINLPLAPHPKSSKRVLVVTADRTARGLRSARTAWRVLRPTPGGLLLELDVCRASRHQIRAHLAHLGYPIVGDPVYGAGPHPALREGHALHACHLSWSGDAELAGFSVDAEPPQEWSAIL